MADPGDSETENRKEISLPTLPLIFVNVNLEVKGSLKLS